MLTNDVTILQDLDLQSTTVISTVMAQTVALDHYSNMVDEMLDIFTAFNHSVEKTGQFTAIEKRDLFKLVAQNNAVLIDVLSKLSLLERSDIAWKMPQYVHLWEGLREEFEVESRFNNLKYKLNLIQVSQPVSQSGRQAVSQSVGGQVERLRGGTRSSVSSS